MYWFANAGFLIIVAVKIIKIKWVEMFIDNDIFNPKDVAEAF